MKIFKNKLIGKMFLLLLSISIIFPSNYNVLAKHSKEQSMSQELRAPASPIQTFQYEKSIHVKNSSNIERYRPAIPTRADGQRAIDTLSVSIASNHEYTFDDLNRLSYANLVDVLVTINTDEITDFWTYSQDVVEFYRDRQRLIYLSDEIEQRGSQYTSNDDRGLATLIEVLNKGFLYQWDFNDPDMDYLKDLSFRAEITPAVLSVMNNSDFALGTDTQEAVVAQIGYLISNSTTDIDMFDEAYSVIRYFNNGVDNYITDPSKTNAIYALLSGLNYNLYYNYRFGPYDTPNQAPWYGQIDTFFNEVAYILNFNQFADTDHEWLIDNAVYVITEEGRFHSNANFALNTLNDALNVYPYYGGVYLALAASVDDLGGNINYPSIVADYEDHYYGNHYTFDDGEFIIKAGDRVSEEDIQRIYWASKEVKAQFHRLYGVNEPVETGNPDDVLTAIIYNDSDEYGMNRYLNGLDTNNGGIYIESWGTFYTWDREVPTDSIYGLEELFRHEYFHFLQSRFLVPGMWGDTDLYNNDRLVWVEEGGGEFFAGSTRTGIDTRSTKIGNIHSNPSDWYTLDQVLHGTYGLWDIYDYSYAFYDFIYNHHMDIFDNVKQYISNEDADGFDHYMDDLARNTNLEDEYHNHIQNLINDGGRVVLVEDDYLVNHSNRSLPTISSDITNEISLRNVIENTYNSDLFDTYTIEGRYVGGRSNGEVNDREAMNNIVNQVLGNLDNRWSGYRTVTAYFVNHRVNSNGDYEYDVVFHGLLPDQGTGTGSDPVADISGPSSALVNETVSFSSDGSYDPDGTIDFYDWNFDDGSTSTRANPTHTFTAPGIYSVRLTVTDNEGRTDTTVTTIRITEEDTGGGEPGIILQTNGTLTSQNSGDNHYFTAVGTGETSITLTVPSANDAITWVLYEAITGDRVDWAIQNGNVHERTMNLVSGTEYEILVYTWETATIDYDLLVIGDGSPTDPTDPGTGTGEGSGTGFDPVADISAPSTAIVNETINFSSDGSYDADGTIDFYDWNFDDGTTSTRANPTHTYTTPGNYSVRLTVTDDQGRTDTTVITIRITEDDKGEGQSSIILETSGTLTSQNSGDNHYFTAFGTGETTITLTVPSANDAITWVLYEAATGVRVGWARQNGNVHEWTMNLVQGTEYEILMYTWETATVDYDLLAIEDGTPTDSTDPGIGG
ncbi:collagenase [Chengkuizengella sp. SCS-71B]|uniref:collagenase n=1 Tax=Chengkuizengella sp. SCS-71B TaxID=3115290 RepID=UPI0032C227AA